jgi:hypothetical protein
VYEREKKIHHSIGEGATRFKIWVLQKKYTKKSPINNDYWSGFWV